MVNGLLYVFIKTGKKVDTYNPMKITPKITADSYTIKASNKGHFKIQKGRNDKEIVVVKGEHFLLGELEDGKSFLTPTKPQFLFEIRLNKKGKPDTGDLCRGIKSFVKTLQDGFYAVFEDLTIEKLR